MADNVITVEYRGRVAVITIDNDKKLNSLSQQQYYRLAQTMKEIATHDEVYVTVLVGKGRYFSAGADVSLASNAPKEASGQHQYWLGNFGAYQINITNAFATHPKILVIGLNGPVIGLSAALTAFADFIYCTPQAFLFTPFSSLGLVAEGGSSRALVLRLGPSKANEALIMSKRITAPELKHCGYVNEIFDFGQGDSDKFKERVLKEVDDRLGDHLVGDSLIGIKKLIKGPEQENMDVQNVREMLAGLERFVAGVPQEQFRRLASGEKRHKL